MTRQHKKKADDNKSKKPRPSGNFHGLRLWYLESELDTFLSRVRMKSMPAYWPKLFSGYWKHIRWCLKLSVKTDLDMFENASLLFDEDLSPGDEKSKNDIFKVIHSISISKLNQSIYCSFQLTTSISKLG